MNEDSAKASQCIKQLVFVARLHLEKIYNSLSSLTPYPTYMSRCVCVCVCVLWFTCVLALTYTCLYVHMWQLHLPLLCCTQRPTEVPAVKEVAWMDTECDLLDSATTRGGLPQIYTHRRTTTAPNHELCDCEYAIKCCNCQQKGETIYCQYIF